jgi:hypothetical protein
MFAGRWFGREAELYAECARIVDVMEVFVRTLDQPLLPLGVRARIAEVLNELDGVADAEAAGLEAPLVRALGHIGALLPADGRDLPAAEQPTGPVLPDDRLLFFRGFRGSEVSITRSRDEAGAAVITLRCGPKEVSFDEPDLLPFAEHLHRFRNGFRADDATRWSNEGYAWERVSELLEALVEGRVLQRLPRQ